MTDDAETVLFNDRDTAVTDRDELPPSRALHWRSSTVRWCMSCSTLVQAAAASCWVVGSSTAAAVPPSLSAAARHEVLDFFLAAFDDIDPNAVPMTVHDDLYAPLVVQFRDENSRRLLGAALTCRAQVAAGAS